MTVEAPIDAYACALARRSALIEACDSSHEVRVSGSPQTGPRFEEVSILRGGMEHWNKAGYPVERGRSFGIYER